MTNTRTPQELKQIEEYKRRLAAGLNPAPLVERVELELIAGKENFDRVIEIEKLQQISKSTLR